MSAKQDIQYSILYLFRGQNLVLTGDFGIYSSDGFIYNFGNNTTDTQLEIQTLNYNNWIDLKTSSMFLEFLIYNPQNHYFSYGIYIFEFFIGGNIFLNEAILTVKIDIYSGTYSVVIIIFQILCLFSIIWFVIYSILNNKEFYKVSC